MNHFLPLRFLLLALLAVACQSQKTQSDQDLSTSFTLEDETISKVKKRVYKADATKPDTLGTNSARLDLSYPIINKWDNEEAKRAFNLLVEGIVDQEVRQYQQDGGIGTEATDQTDTLLLTKDQAKTYIVGSAAFDTWLTINYRVTQQTEALIAVEFGVSKFLGGAHDDKRSYTLNFDVANKKALTLKDLFKPDADYMQLVANFCQQDLLKRKDQIGSDSATIIEGTAADSLRYFANFGIRPEGLEFLFDPYQVAPYASGEQRVLVPRAVLEAAIAPGSMMEKIK